MKTPLLGRVLSCSTIVALRVSLLSCVVHATGKAPKNRVIGRSEDRKTKKQVVNRDSQIVPVFPPTGYDNKRARTPSECRRETAAESKETNSSAPIHSPS